MQSSAVQQSRIHNRLGIAREAFPFLGIGLVMTLLFLFLGVLWLTILAGALTLFVLYFFRDPEREAGVQDKAVLTPADGRVLGAWTLGWMGWRLGLGRAKHRLVLPENHSLPCVCRIP